MPVDGIPKHLVKTLSRAQFEKLADVLFQRTLEPVSYTHLRAHETVLDLVCRLLLEKKNNETILATTLLHNQT